MPKTGGVRPQLLVTVDLDSLLGRPGSLGGETGWAGPLAPEACRRLACDGAVTRVLVSRHPGGGGHADQGPDDQDVGAAGDRHEATDEVSGRGGAAAGLVVWLRAAAALLPPVLGAPPASPWRSAGPPGWCRPPSGPPWPSGMGAVSSPAAIGPWPGVTPIICGTGSTVARPI